MTDLRLAAAVRGRHHRYWAAGPWMHPWIILLSRGREEGSASFLKKKAKNFCPYSSRWPMGGYITPTGVSKNIKSFLLLFFKKEALSFLSILPT
jgi:hypothetical protein